MISPVDNPSNSFTYPTIVDQRNAVSQTDSSISPVDKNKEQDSSQKIPLSKTADSELTISQEAREAQEQGYTEEELKKIEELQRRDQVVRAHEQAHQSAAGSLSNGGVSFDYQSGPDGKRYAVGGEVSIDTSKVANDPQATIAKARQIRRAALAPVDPSGQDRQVAAQAVEMEAQASKELASEKFASPGKEQTPAIPGPINSAKTDFYQQIQSAASDTENDKNTNSYGDSGRVSKLDFYV